MISNTVSTTIYSGSADWTSSPRALDRESRSKSEKVLNRKSRLLENDNRDTLSDDVVLNDEFEKFGQLKKSHDIGSISSGLRYENSPKVTQILIYILVLENQAIRSIHLIISHHISPNPVKIFQIGTQFNVQLVQVHVSCFHILLLFYSA